MPQKQVIWSVFGNTKFQRGISIVSKDQEKEIMSDLRAPGLARVGQVKKNRRNTPENGRKMHRPCGTRSIERGGGGRKGGGTVQNEQRQNSHYKGCADLVAQFSLL